MLENSLFPFFSGTSLLKRALKRKYTINKLKMPLQLKFKISSCPLCKQRIESTSLTEKSTSPGLLDMTFFACWYFKLLLITMHHICVDIRWETNLTYLICLGRFMEHSCINSSSWKRKDNPKWFVIIELYWYQMKPILKSLNGNRAGQQAVKQDLESTHLNFHVGPNLN